MVTVERAKFEMKGQAYDATKKPKKLGKKELEKIKRRKDKLLAWIPDQVPPTPSRVPKLSKLKTD